MMATIHPKPKLLHLRSDGDDGMQMTVTTSRGEFEVMDVSPEQAAAWSAQLSGFVAQRLKKTSEAEAQATLNRIRQNRGLT